MPFTKEYLEDITNPGKVTNLALHSFNLTRTTNYHRFSISLHSMVQMGLGVSAVHSQLETKTSTLQRTS
jgi:hypothetical protein